MSTFGKGKRQTSDNPQSNPAPNQYNPLVTTTSYEDMRTHEKRGPLFGKGTRDDAVTQMNHESMKNVGPGSYNPDWNQVMRVGTSKKMLSRTVQSEKRLETIEPGPGQYQLPSGFNLQANRKPVAPTLSRKKPEDNTKLSKEKLIEDLIQKQHNERKSRKKQAHFGTSTRDGVVLERWDEDTGIRETHNPNLKMQDRNSMRMRTQTTPGPGTYNFSGDFVYRNLNDPDSIGKLPKFHFGIKHAANSKDLEVPGVGNVDVDQPP